MRNYFVAVLSLVSVYSVQDLGAAQPSSGPQSSTDNLSPTKRPDIEVTKRNPPKAATYGLCSAPQNAEAFPAKPVPVETDQCHHFQKFTAMSNTPSYGGSCGGFTVAFGPMGDLRPNLHRIVLTADWGDIALNASTCASAKLAAVGWGDRCTDDACTSTKWEKIGGPQQRSGGWNSTSKVCYMSVAFASVDKKYKTLNLDIIATVVEDGKTVRKRAKGTIVARIGNGKCVSIPAKQR